LYYFLTSEYKYFYYDCIYLFDFLAKILLFLAVY
jgi:hypothetical protein